MKSTDYEKLFPNKIDLGREEVSIYPIDSEKGTKTEKKKITIYPTLYIDYVEGMEALPDSGYVLAKIELVGTDKRKDRYNAGRTKGSMTLEVQAICLPEDGETEESLISKMFSNMDETKGGKDDSEEDGKE